MAPSKSTKLWFIAAIVAVLGLTLAAVLYFSLGRSSIARGYSNAVQAFQQGNYDESIRLLTQVVVHDRSNEEAYRLLAQAAHKTGDFPLAVRAWTQAAYLNPLDKTLPLQRDRERLTAGMYPMVIESLQSKINNGTATPDETVLYAAAQLRAGDIGKAEDAVATLPEGFTSPDRVQLAADLDFMRDRLPEAKKRYETLVKSDSDILRAQAFLGLAAIAARTNDTEEALRLLLEASKQNPYVAGLPLGRFFMNQGEFEKAKLPLQRGIKAYGSLEGMVDLAEVYASLGDLESLRVLAQSTPASNRTLAEAAYYFESILAFLNSDIPAMRQKLDLCTNYQSRPLYRLMALQVAVALGDPLRIRDAVEKLVVAADTPQARAHIVTLLAPAFESSVKARNLSRAEGLARALLSIAQPSSETYLRAQNFLMGYDLSRGNFAEARKLAAEVLRAHPDNAPAVEIMGRSLLLTAPEQSLSYFERLHKASPKEARFLEGMALANAALGRDDRADAQMRELWLLAPESPQNILTYGQFLVLKNRWAQIDALEADLAKSKNPKVQALGDYLQGQALERKGDKAGAVAAYRRCADKDPVFPGAWTALAALLPAEQGVEALRQGLTRLPGNVDLSYRLAFLLAGQNQNREAADIYAALLKAEPDNGLVLVNFSEVLAALNENDRALALAKQAYESYPQWPISGECYGMRLIEAKDYAAAIDILTPALDALPKNARIQKALVSALRAEGQKAVQRGDKHLQTLYFTRIKSILPDDAEAAQVLKRLEEEANSKQAS